MKTEIAKIWEQLEAESHDSNSSTAQVRRIIPDGKLDLYIGYQNSDKKRFFMLEFAKQNNPFIETIPKLKGLNIFIAQSISEKNNHISLFIQLKNNRFNDLFSLLIDDLSSELTSLDDELLAIELILKRLKEWQQFVENEASELLTREVLRGLYGELHFLLNRLIPIFGPAALFCWKGYSSSNQDFYVEKDAIEVKTSIAKQHQKIMISNERQLDNRFFDNLYLYHLSLDEIDMSKHTLPNLIELIEEKIENSPDAVKTFEEALFEIGYSKKFTKQYSAYGYEVREENIFEVNDEFPKVIETDLMPGVGDITYSVLVSECRNYLTSWSVFESYRVKDVS